MTVGAKTPKHDDSEYTDLYSTQRAQEFGRNAGRTTDILSKSYLLSAC